MPFLYQTFYNFRNLKNDKIDLSNREVYFVGENGQGKSNILESLYYASYGISFRTHVDSQIVKKGETQGHIAFEITKLGGLTYNPIFIPNGFDKTVIEMGDEEFQKVHNHRMAALEGVLEELRRA